MRQTLLADIRCWEIWRWLYGSGRCTGFFTFHVMAGVRTVRMFWAGGFFSGLMCSDRSSWNSLITRDTTEVHAGVFVKDKVEDIFLRETPFWWRAKMAALVSELILAGIFAINCERYNQPVKEGYLVWWFSGCDKSLDMGLKSLSCGNLLVCTGLPYTL